MGNKINVAEILKDKPKGTKLYSDICCGECVLNEVSENAIYVDMYNKERFWFFSVYGTIYAFPNGGVLLYPSYEMRDWRKFAWKKGDVLVNKDNNSHIIFEKFNDDTYTTFTGKLYYQATKAGYSYAHTRNIAMTQDFDIEEGDAAQTYINTIEEKLGGKLNRETLEVEKTQPEFKDGDIAFADYGNRQDIFIVSEKTNLSEGYSSFICLDLRCLTLVMGFRTSFFKKDLCKLRLATEEEKQQLFDALAKEGKAWDAEKKEVVGLKPKVEFKPFDKVLVRDNEDDIWEVSLFGYKDELYYRCDNGIPWIQCIPYDGNEHLLGTTNNVEG